MALCCDVIQNDFFAKWDIKDLMNKYRDAINVLCSQNFEPLQLVIAVALLKELVNYLWSSLESFQNIETEPMMFNNEIEGIDEAIEDINLAIEHLSPLIHSLKLYFLHDLYVKGLSLHRIEGFCQVQYRTFPWLTDFDWEESNSKINFVAYHCYDQYIEAEDVFTPLYKHGQHMQFEQFLNRVSNNLTINAKMSIIGILITRLYNIRAIRELNMTEEYAIKWLCNRLPAMKFGQFYIDKLLALLDNTNQLYSISTETNQTELLIKSVIIHTIALYSCIAAVGSPLAAYLQTEDFYEGQYGYKYIVGYVYESVESRKYINYYLRDLTPVFYRILHLLVHILIAAAPDADWQEFFSNPQQNNEIIQEPLVYCQRHIENDWQILTHLFDCDDEILAFALYSILHSISKNPNEALIRLAWENKFFQYYINPKDVNAHCTTTDFQKMIKDSQRTLESEINETLDINEKYQYDFHP
ncbi:e3 ubiquitin-protein ligase [Gigaspora margarita]|uniref:E3 ubiquitin-protein ligase n=1 Tax=Gigaspora margarita TaxID=4874 RepID=A0A8H4EIT2_GIGMA|nr:e3 ubiquitin-protein ligase [Gigaspora margarita]